MKSRPLSFAILILAGMSVLPGSASAQQGTPQDTKVASVKDPDALRTAEGAKRFHANCGRCHQAPRKFPPRTSATIIRHMRVRAMITDQDMRLILRFMNQ